ncbi:MAG TPA: ScpA family protein [Dehalococcoidia bacterium]|nr:ScpA family protein [Dehalococcoidia bacterium]
MKIRKTPNQLSTSHWSDAFAIDILGQMVQIAVDGFSGPIDLLLDLIDRKQLDITVLSLADVTDQYWREMESAELDPDALAEFLNVGSRLLFIKSSALLVAPEPKPDLNEQLEEAAGELAELLEEHKRFKDAVDLFRQLEEEGRRTFARAAPVKSVPLPPGLEGITVDTLLAAVKEALATKPPEPEEAVLHIEPVTVNEKIDEISGALGKRSGRLTFRPLLDACKTRTEVVVLFLAVLEMIKGGNLWAEQEEPFGDITLVETAPEPAAGV